jgi:hypothetical protein
VAALSEWLQLMLAEISRKREELERAASEQAQRRRDADADADAAAASPLTPHRRPRD